MPEQLNGEELADWRAVRCGIGGPVRDTSTRSTTFSIHQRSRKAWDQPSHPLLVSAGAGWIDPHRCRQTSRARREGAIEAPLNFELRLATQVSRSIPSVIARRSWFDGNGCRRCRRPRRGTPPASPRGFISVRLLFRPGPTACGTSLPRPDGGRCGRRNSRADPVAGWRAHVRGAARHNS
jgi:hypothetical protein